ncbi:unnamed protein product, partial [Prorocentrum cordatum]
AAESPKEVPRAPAAPAAVAAAASAPEAQAEGPAAVEPAVVGAAGGGAQGPAAVEVAGSVEKRFTDSTGPIGVPKLGLQQASFQAQAGRYQTSTANVGSPRKPLGRGRAEFKPMSSSKTQASAGRGAAGNGAGKGAGRGAAGGRGRGAGRGGEPQRPSASAR